VIGPCGETLSCFITYKKHGGSQGCNGVYWGGWEEWKEPDNPMASITVPAAPISCYQWRMQRIFASCLVYPRRFLFATDNSHFISVVTSSVSLRPALCSEADTQ
jgi:hypothetical protein